jgi:hypothetical protein
VGTAVVVLVLVISGQTEQLSVSQQWGQRTGANFVYTISNSRF